MDDKKITTREHYIPVNDEEREKLLQECEWALKKARKPIEYVLTFDRLIRCKNELPPDKFMYYYCAFSRKSYNQNRKNNDYEMMEGDIDGELNTLLRKRILLPEKMIRWWNRNIDEYFTHAYMDHLWDGDKDNPGIHRYPETIANYLILLMDPELGWYNPKKAFPLICFFLPLSKKGTEETIYPILAYLQSYCLYYGLGTSRNIPYAFKVIRSITKEERDLYNKNRAHMNYDHQIIELSKTIAHAAYKPYKPKQENKN